MNQSLHVKAKRGSENSLRSKISDYKKEKKKGGGDYGVAESWT